VGSSPTFGIAWLGQIRGGVVTDLVRGQRRGQLAPFLPTPKMSAFDATSTHRLLQIECAYVLSSCRTWIRSAHSAATVRGGGARRSSASVGDSLVSLRLRELRAAPPTNSSASSTSCRSAIFLTPRPRFSRNTFHRSISRDSRSAPRPLGDRERHSWRCARSSLATGSFSSRLGDGYHPFPSRLAWRLAQLDPRHSNSSGSSYGFPKISR
jgi:hypothetical protein